MLVSDVVNGAREILQDQTTPYRYSTADLVQFTQQAVETAFRLRPDLAIGEAWPVYTTAAMDAALPLELGRLYGASIVEHVAAAAERRDSQFSEDSRLLLLYQRFEKALMAGGS